jgi:hypothetical protein
MSALLGRLRVHENILFGLENKLMSNAEYRLLERQPAEL